MEMKKKIVRKWKMVVAVVLVVMSDIEWNEKRVEGESDVGSSMIVK